MADVAPVLEEHPWTASYPKDVDWNTPIPAVPVTDLLDESARRFPDRPCLDFLGKRYRYAEVAALVDRAARGFQKAGVVKGTRVGLFLPNSPYFIIGYYAILKAGGTVVNFNPLYAERELRHQIADSGVELMVTLDLHQLYDKIAPHLGEARLRRLVVCPMAGILPFPKNWLFGLFKRKEVARIPRDDRHLTFAALTRNDGRPEPVALDPKEDVAVLQYTGGTTGVPKGAMLTHANVVANAFQAEAWYSDAKPGDERVLGVLPLFHVFAMTAVMNLGLRLGAEIVLLPRFDLLQVMKTIQESKITFFPLVPTIVTSILRHKDLKAYDLSSLSFCISGGAPLPVEVMHAFERSTSCDLVEGYGVSEASPVACCNPKNGVRKKGSIGLPFPGTVVEIVSTEEPRNVLPVGERGEICVRGPQVMKGYWNKPEENALSLQGGRFHTGDIGVMDEEGYVYILDRIKDLILCGGFNVYPRNVEEAIYLHPAVAECIVAGVPDQYRGQTVKAYIRLHEGRKLTKSELTTFLKDKLSPVEIPKFVEFRDSLPKTLIGKLSRKAILEEEEARRAASGKAHDGNDESKPGRP
ncbi:long-chain fatty acid--CoA ligase [Azospirillum sp. SYSU D00513]|uniref:long-chain-fatty-acid--CoA ligase n=1 Tax=Azospirillum sp. SYSU D00513 TaxID=2812561 RepID=UPI001A970C4F|nr:long-chain fatty acid--CoA ligase [Azospirillum sp. SYSU D00513]